MAELLGEGIVSIKADVKECIDFFDNINVSEKTIKKAILRSVGQGGKRAVKKNYPNVLKKRTGQLFKSIKYRVYRSGGAVVITNSATSGRKTAKDGREARYGFMLASGYSIIRKLEDGTESVTTVAPRDFTEGPVNRYLDSNTCETDIDKAFQKQIDRVEKKLGVK